MTGTTETAAAAPVRKSVTVRADIHRAFRVFTDDFDSWCRARIIFMPVPC